MNMSKPDYSQIFINHHRWLPEYEKYILPAGGYLIAVGVRYDDHTPDILVNPAGEIFWLASFSLRREGAGLGEPSIAVLNWGHMYNQCGVGFPAPVPDVNNANPIVIKRDAPVKTRAVLLVTTVHLGLL